MVMPIRTMNRRKTKENSENHLALESVASCRNSGSIHNRNSSAIQGAVITKIDHPIYS